MEIGQGSTPSNHGDTMEGSTPCDNPSFISHFPYASRLGSNDILSEDEIEEIKGHLLQPTEQIREIEAEITSLQARLNLFRSRHAALTNEVEACRALITLSRRLPDDILLEIFFRCLPEATNPTLDATTSPLLLTAVCRRWRFLALQTPRLWAAIGLPISDMPRSIICAWIHSRDDANQRGLLHEWLARSGTCPLTLSVVAYKEYYNMKSDRDIVAADCLNALLPLSSRWKNVFLKGRSEVFSTLLTAPFSNFQSLESLFLQIPGRHFPAIPFNSAPFLRKLSIQYPNLDPSTLAGPWARLTHLDLGDGVGETAPEIGPLSTILNLCTSLIYLGLDIDYGEIVHPMYLPKLQRLSIRQHVSSQDSNTFRLFADNLHAPSLRLISMRDLDAESFLAFLSKHGRAIQRLDLNARYIHFDALVDGLRHCPSLQALSIVLRISETYVQSFKADKKFFALFTGNVETDIGPLCPLLQELLFDNFPCDTLKGLVSFLERKQYADPRICLPLTTLSIDHLGGDGRHFSKQTVKHALKPFTDDGLLFEMWNGHRPYLYGGSQTDDFGDGPGFQHADCWRD